LAEIDEIRIRARRVAFVGSIEGLALEVVETRKMPNLRREVLRGVPGLAFSIGDYVSIRLGQVGSDGCCPVAAAWIEEPGPDCRTYYTALRLRVPEGGGREAVSESLEEITSSMIEVTAENLETARLALIENNTAPIPLQ
jgi:hypothetical protein